MAVLGVTMGEVGQTREPELEGGSKAGSAPAGYQVLEVQVQGANRVSSC